MSHEMQTVIAEMEDIKHIKKTLTTWLKEEVDHGKECFDTNSCGAVSDIIKDMAETMKECYETCYYETVIEAMKKYDDSRRYDDMESMGYNHNHYASGKFAPTGSGHYVSGYVPEYVMNEGRNSEMGSSSRNRNGYNPHLNRMGMNANEYGEAYDAWMDSKRHYTESKSITDKRDLDEKSIQLAEQSLSALKKIWEEADPELKQKLKPGVQALSKEMME